jgi:peptidoglycan/LPS O-acetylase OafA/YrhL
MAEQKQRSEKLHALTSLRFFAAAFVVLYHFIWEFFPGISRQSLGGRLIEMGHVSVSFFFLLSGYILGVVYLKRGGAVARRPFFLARFARVYPLFFLTLVVDTPFLFSTRVATYGLKAAVLKTGVSFVGNATMLQAWILWFRGINNPCWSLSVETLFYLSFPWIGVALWRLKGARLWLMALLLYVGGQALVLVTAPHMLVDYGSMLPLLHLTTFALGILLARWQSLTQADGGASSATGLAAWAVTIVSAVCFAAAVYWSPVIPFSSLNDGLLAPIFMGLIWAFSHARWLPARVLSAKWLVVLGEASYGVYLIQTPVYHVFERLHWETMAAMFPVYMGTTIALSVLSFFYFETPVRRWLLKRGETRVKETMEMASDAQ